MTDGALPARAALVAGLAAIAALVFAVPLPPVQDYPNHLARYWLIATGARVPPTSAMFAIDWRNASTNIGADLAVAALTIVLPYWLAGKLVLLGAIAGPPTAAAWLNRVLFGRWSWWSPVFLLLAWTTTSLYGFLNYQLALAAALVFAGLEARARLRPTARFATRVLSAAAALLIHPFGLVFYAALLVALTIGPSWDALAVPRRLGALARAMVAPVAAAALPVVVLLLVSPHLPGEHHNDAQASFVRGRLSAFGLFLTAASPFLTYRTAIDLLAFAPVAALALLAVVAGKARAHAGVLTVGLALFALAIVMPTKLGDATALDRRLPLMAALALFAGVLPEPFGARHPRALAAAALGLVLLRTAWIGSVWIAREVDVRAVEAALRPVPQGAAVLAVQAVPADVAAAPVGRFLAAEPYYQTQTTLMHVPVMAIPWRRAFVPTLFAVTGQQPVRVLPPWDALKSRTLEVPDIRLLDAGPSPGDRDGFRHLADWRKTFDYVVAIGMDGTDDRSAFAPPSGLTLAADEHYARLYRVER